MAEATAPVKASSAPGLKLDNKAGRLHTDETSLKAPKLETTTTEAKDVDVSVSAATETAEPVESAHAKPDKDKPAEPKERRAERFAKLAREDAALRAERDRVKAREDAVAAAEQTNAARLKKAEAVEEFEAKRALAGQNTPEGRAARQWLMSATGLDFKVLAKDVVEPDKVDPAAVARAEVERINAESAKKKAEDEKVTETKRQAEEIRLGTERTLAELKRTADAGGKKYLLTRKYNATESAFQVMAEQYKLDKTILSYDAALEKVEADLRRQVREDPELAEVLRELATPAAAEKKPKAGDTSLKATREADKSRDVESRKQANSAPRQDGFNPKRHVDELLARHRARLNT